MKQLCPGTHRMLDNAQDLQPAAFRKLVGRRAQKLLATPEQPIGPVETEDQRRALELAIDQHFEKIHLEADFVPARFLSDGAQRATAVCRISTPTSLGTGFLIGSGFLMTNNHVLPTAEIAGRSLSEFGFEEGSNTTLSAIQPERLFITSVELDFTIVGCDPGPLTEIQPIQLLTTPADATRNERVNVIQHPAGREKEVALHDNRVERVLDTVLKYRTDTEPGSSGSPVFNNDWELVALHHSGVSEPGGSALNEGVRISAIVDHLLAESAGSQVSPQALRQLLTFAESTSPARGFFDTAPQSALEVEIPDFTGSPDYADVGVWNIEHFNSSISQQRLEQVSAVVERLALDVLGLVEVQQEPMEKLVASLATSGVAADFRLLNVTGGQDIAVLFDSSTTTVELRDDLTERHQQRLAATTATGRTAFPRAPLFAHCKVEAEDRGQVEFILIVVHLKAFGDAQSRSRRRLAAELLAEIIEDIRSLEGLPVILGGDFNDLLNTDTLAPIQSAPDLFALTADDASSDAISFVGSSHRSLIDHIIVSHDVVLGEISGDDAAIVRLDQSVADFADQVSDHVPIVFRMVLIPAVIDAPVAQPDGGTVFRIPIPAGAEDLRLEIKASSS